MAASERLHRRHGRRPVDVDDRQRPRRPASVPHRPARARRAVPDDRLVGPLRPRLAQRRPAAVRGAGHADRRLLRRASAATAPATSAPSTTASSSPSIPKNPLPFASPGGDVYREEQDGEFDAAGSAEPAVGGRVSRRPRAPGADQVVRAGVPDADGRCPRCMQFDARSRRSHAASTASTATPRGRSAQTA